MKRFLRNIRHFKELMLLKLKGISKNALQYHPDKNPGDKSAEEKFKLAAEAYEV
jgi:hypothetical protein